LNACGGIGAPIGPRNRFTSRNSLPPAAQPGLPLIGVLVELLHHQESTGTTHAARDFDHAPLAFCRRTICR
jgi:hypothetical protein